MAVAEKTVDGFAAACSTGFAIVAPTACGNPCANLDGDGQIDISILDAGDGPVVPFNVVLLGPSGGPNWNMIATPLPDGDTYRPRFIGSFSGACYWRSPLRGGDTQGGWYGSEVRLFTSGSTKMWGLNMWALYQSVSNPNIRIPIIFAGGTSPFFSAGVAIPTPIVINCADSSNQPNGRMGIFHTSYFQFFSVTLSGVTGAPCNVNGTFVLPQVSAGCRWEKTVNISGCGDVKYTIDLSLASGSGSSQMVFTVQRVSPLTTYFVRSITRPAQSLLLPGPQTFTSGAATAIVTALY